MEALAALICIIPTAWELYDDRRGETKKDKIRDVFITVILYALIALALWWMFETHPLKSLALMVAIRIAFFDYAIVWILRRRGVINPKAKVFSYTGKSTWFWDQWMARFNPLVRLAFRLLLFAVALWLFLT